MDGGGDEVDRLQWRQQCLLFGNMDDECTAVQGNGKEQDEVTMSDSVECFPVAHFAETDNSKARAIDRSATDNCVMCKAENDQ